MCTPVVSMLSSRTLYSEPHMLSSMSWAKITTNVFNKLLDYIVVVLDSNTKVWNPSFISSNVVETFLFMILVVFRLKNLSTKLLYADLEMIG